MAATAADEKLEARVALLLGSTQPHKVTPFASWFTDLGANVTDDVIRLTNIRAKLNAIHKWMKTDFTIGLFTVALGDNAFIRFNADQLADASTPLFRVLNPDDGPGPIIFKRLFLVTRRISYFAFELTVVMEPDPVVHVANMRRFAIAKNTLNNSTLWYRLVLEQLTTVKSMLGFVYTLHLTLTRTLADTQMAGVMDPEIRIENVRPSARKAVVMLVGPSLASRFSRRFATSQTDTPQQIRATSPDSKEHGQLSFGLVFGQLVHYLNMHMQFNPFVDPEVMLAIQLAEYTRTTLHLRTDTRDTGEFSLLPRMFAMMEYLLLRDLTHYFAHTRRIDATSAYTEQSDNNLAWDWPRAAAQTITPLQEAMDEFESMATPQALMEAATVFASVQFFHASRGTWQDIVNPDSNTYMVNDTPINDAFIWRGVRGQRVNAGVLATLLSVTASQLVQPLTHPRKHFRAPLLLDPPLVLKLATCLVFQLHLQLADGLALNDMPLLLRIDGSLHGKDTRQTTADLVVRFAQWQASPVAPGFFANVQRFSDAFPAAIRALVQAFPMFEQDAQWRTHAWKLGWMLLTFGFELGVQAQFLTDALVWYMRIVALEIDADTQQEQTRHHVEDALGEILDLVADTSVRPVLFRRLADDATFVDISRSMKAAQNALAGFWGEWRALVQSDRDDNTANHVSTMGAAAQVVTHIRLLVRMLEAPLRDGPAFMRVRALALYTQLQGAYVLYVHAFMHASTAAKLKDVQTERGTAHRTSMFALGPIPAHYRLETIGCAQCRGHVTSAIFSPGTSIGERAENA